MNHIILVHGVAVEGLQALARIDLNLLTVFAVVAETRQVTQAAKLLGVSQPAVSHALRRLRDTFDDPLFVKSTQGMVLTPLAQSLAKPIEATLLQLQGQVFEREVFDPMKLERTFKLRSTDYLESLLTPKLLAVLAVQAPGVRLVVKSAGFGLPKADLELGACDLAIAGFFGDLPDGFYQQRLFVDGFQCAVRRDHPRLGRAKKLSIDEYCAERHILISPGGDLTGPVDKILQRHKRSRLVVGGMSSFMVSGWLVSDTDCLLTAPVRLIERLRGPFQLHCLPPPFAIPEIKLVQVWHERNHKDKAHHWFRGLVQSLLA